MKPTLHHEKPTSKKAPKSAAPKKVKTAEKIIETHEVKLKETFIDRLKKFENFKELKREAKQSGNAEAFTAALKAEREWLKSIAIPLPLELKKNGFVYKQIKRGEKSALYEQLDENIVQGHEIFLLKVQPPCIIFKKEYEAKEIFPSNESFGLWAWSVGTDLEYAKNRFLQIEESDIVDVDIDENEIKEDEEE
jgi:hypothetical protein